MVDIIGAGASRTGTSSLKFALERLGFGPAYHFAEMILHPEHAVDWLDALGDRSLVARPLAGYRASLDYPANQYWFAQARLFPEARVILTLRDESEWYESMRETLMQRQFLQTLQGTPIVPLLARLGMFGANVKSREDTIHAYRNHIALVRARIPPERLLEFNVAEGWDPLCRFLGCAVPDSPFPRVNDRSAFGGMTGGAVPLTFAQLQDRVRATLTPPT